jgi:glycosyltransferase involved in cell wall biosynthesis
MRAVYLNPVGEIGGGELSLLDLLASISEAIPGIERHLIVAGDGPLIARARALGVTVHALPLPPALAGLGDSGLRSRGRLGKFAGLLALALPALSGLRSYAHSLRVLLDQIEPTIVHSNGIKMHLLLHLCGFSKAPLVWHVRDFYGSRPLIKAPLRWVSRGVSNAIAISDAVAKDAQALFPRLPVTVVYNAIDTERFSPGGGDGAGLDRLAGLTPAPEGTVRVGLVATYARWKGQDLFLQAIALEKQARPARFYIVGGPIYKTTGSQFSESELRALAEGLGVADRVAFVPFQASPADVFRALDVVIHASTSPEPFGRTIVEAMACGRPVIVSNAGGAAELFTDGTDAIGFPPGDAARLAAAIDSLIEDPARRQSIGASARATAVARFTRDRLGREVAAVYQVASAAHFFRVSR